MNENVKKLLKPIASLRLTVPLLFMAMVLVYAGTSAQKETGIWEVQHWYFHSFFCKIPFKYMLPLSEWWWQHASIRLPGVGSISKFPFLGGYTLIGLLLINLLAAHTVRFKFAWKRTGILMIHFGLILLLVGGVLTSRLANEAVMSLNNGQSQHYAEDIRDVELAVTDPSSPDHDTVVVVDSSRLNPVKRGRSCRTHACRSPCAWTRISERRIRGPDAMSEAKADEAAGQCRPQSRPRIKSSKRRSAASAKTVSRPTCPALT